MKANIEKHIPRAIQQIDSYYTANHNNPITKEYKGYLSSLGASIIMSGLLPTLAVYYAEESNSKADRRKVINWVYEIIISLPFFNNCNGKPDLFKYAIDVKDDRYKTDRLIEEILNISIALKLSIRTFPLV
ncbi:MAG TPA: type III-B CRISPR module-associated protein Cmr5 [Bacteroidales bacterium]|nr:type III-B CRISPR module-associated protein Cmr5 [Bacteroidales bacterium]